MEPGFLVDGIIIVVLLAVAAFRPSITNSPLFALASVAILGRVLWREFDPRVVPPPPAPTADLFEEEDEDEDEDVIAADEDEVTTTTTTPEDDLGKEFMLGMRTSGVYNATNTQGFYRNLVGEELESSAEGQRRRPYLMSRSYSMCPDDVSGECVET